MKRTLHDLASLAARIGVGGIFFANGWQKLEAGLNATSAQFAQLGAPAHKFWAAATMLIELVGGTLLIGGLAVSAIGLLLFVEALAVFILAAGETGLPLTGGNISLIVALGAASVLLAVNGGGRLSIDYMVVIKRRDPDDLDRELTADEAADAEADAVINALREPKPQREPKPETATSPKGPVTFPASTPSEDSKEVVTEELPKPKPRRPKRGEETTSQTRSGSQSRTGTQNHTDTQNRAEAPATETPKGGETGDTLVAGRRATKTE